MGKPANGRAADNTLVYVQGNIRLETATAAAYLAAKAAGGLTISPPLGGYRSYQDQANLKADPAAYGSSLKSSQIAGPGNSTHGYGDCVDITANNAWFQTHCGSYGFVRESPAGENNHYRYLHPTWATPTVAVVDPNGLTADDIRRVATYLNGRATEFGAPTTTANTSGTTGPRYWTLVQCAGADDGLYPQPAYKIDGIPGPKTYELEQHYRELTIPVVAPPVVTPPVVVPDPPVVTPPVEPTDPVVTVPVTSDPVVTTPTTGSTPVVTPPASGESLPTQPTTPENSVPTTKPVAPKLSVWASILGAIKSFLEKFRVKS